MKWEIIPASTQFQSSRDDWDALNKNLGDHILLDSEFVGALLHHFGNDGVYLGISTDTKHPGMALLARTRWGSWETFQPSQAPMGLILLGSRDQNGDSLLDLIRSLPGYALQCAALHQDPDFSSLPVSPQWPCMEFLDYIQTGSLTIGGTFEQYWESRTADLKRNNARRHRRIAEQGHKLELTVHSDPEAVPACIREYGRLESQGWKGQQGTAVGQDNAQGRFYQDVMTIFCSRKEGLIFELRLDGTPIASELWIGRHGMLVNLKTTYDENLKQFSPGFLMKEALLRNVFDQQKWHVLEFYGRVMDWHLKWINRTRTLYHVNCFRNRWFLNGRNTAKRFLKSSATGRVRTSKELEVKPNGEAH